MSGPWEDFAADDPGPWTEFAAEGAPTPAAKVIPPEGAARREPRRKRNIYGEVAGAMANFNRGLGIGDEIVAGAKTVGGLLSGQLGEGGLLGSFNANMASQRSLEDDYAADRPNVAGMLRNTGVAGTALIPAGGSAGLLASSPRWLNIGRGAVTGAGTAAAYSAVDRGTPAERLRNASRATTDPTVLALGAAGGALAPAASRMRPPKRQPAPTLEELSTAKNAAYQAVDAAGVRYAPTAVDGLVADITQDVQSVNINAARHPRAASMLSDIQAMKGQSPTLTELDQLRQVIRRDVASAPDAAEAFFGKRMIRKLDGFIDGAGPAQVVSGSATDAAGMLRSARDLNTRVRKIESITEGVDRAKMRAGSTGSGGNVDNATRQEMRRIFEKTPNLTETEGAMLERIIVGTRGQNALRQVGKLSPQGNGLMTALSIGGAAANPLLAVPTAAGALSKVAADRMTQRGVEDLIDEIARGGSPAANEALRDLAARNPQIDALLEAASARMSRVGGAAAAPVEIEVNQSTHPEYLAWRRQQGR